MIDGIAKVINGRVSFPPEDCPYWKDKKVKNFRAKEWEQQQTPEIRITKRAMEMEKRAREGKIKLQKTNIDDPNNRYHERYEMYCRGMSDAEIAEKEGRKESTIRMWRSQNGLYKIDDKNRISEADNKERMALYSIGLSDKEIAMKLGKSASSIREWRKRRGLPANYKSGGRVERIWH